MLRIPKTPLEFLLVWCRVVWLVLTGRPTNPAGHASALPVDFSFTAAESPEPLQRGYYNYAHVGTEGIEVGTASRTRGTSSTGQKTEQANK